MVALKNFWEGNPVARSSKHCALAFAAWLEHEKTHRHPEKLNIKLVYKVNENMKEQPASISLLHVSSEAEQQFTADCDKMICVHDSSAA